MKDNNRSKAAKVLRTIKDKHTPVGVVKSAMGLAKDKVAQYKSAAGLKNMRGNFAVQKAQKIHKEKYGQEMSPSVLRNELRGGILSKEAKDYLRTKRDQTKNLNK